MNWPFKKNSGEVMVLMYHRITHLEYDPWGLAVSPENFEQQLAVLKKHYNLISTNELFGQVKKGKIIPGSVCITFDDGYSDNFFEAKKILEKI